METTLKTNKELTLHMVTLPQKPTTLATTLLPMEAQGKWEAWVQTLEEDAKRARTPLGHHGENQPPRRVTST
jgi:hypothetical protein